jgi:hypothetical protein
MNFHSKPSISTNSFSPPKKLFKIVSKAKNTPSHSTNSPINIRKPLNKKKFKLKTKPIYNPHKQFSYFVDLCNTHNIPYIQFFDENNWKGPAAKVNQYDFDRVSSIFYNAQSYLKTITLNGYGFVIIKPIQHIDDSNIKYPKENYQLAAFTEHQNQPYNSDTEHDTYDSDALYDEDTQDEDEEEFIAEEWTYNGFTYLLNPNNNHLYFPATLEFAGKKTSEFSIDRSFKE